MENIRLYLIDDSEENNPKHYEVDLDEQVKFAITSQFEDLNNPTTIINTWSKSISIPFTVNNNRIFSQLYRPDRVVTPDSPLGTFDFDATQKVSFILTYLDALVMDGFMKILSVERESDIKGKYNVTLNGELGKVLQTLQKLNFNIGDTSNEYSINTSRYVQGIMNADLVRRCWENVPIQKTESLIHYGEEGYDILDYIGFIPNLSFSEGFDYKLAELPLENGKYPTVSLGDFADRNLPDNLGYKPSDFIKDGVNPRSFGEFRSWLQIPYIYFNKLFNIFKEEGERITGYKFILDGSWFNDLNPYWSKQVMCLEPSKPQGLNTGKEYTFQQTITTNETYPYSAYEPSYNSSNRMPTTPSTYNIYVTYGDDIFYNFETRQFDFTPSLIPLELSSSQAKLTVTFDVPGNRLEEDVEFGLTQSCRIYLRLIWTNPETGFTDIERLAITNSSEEVIYQLEQYKVVHFPNTNQFTYKSYNIQTNLTTYKVEIPLPLNTLFSADFSKLLLSTQIWCGNNTNSLFYYRYNGVSGDIWDYSIAFNNTWNIIGTSGVVSNSPINLNFYWNAQFSLYDIIIEYCKLYKILIICDAINNTLTFIPSRVYFNNYTIEDWSDKVDYSKPFKIENIMAQDYSFKFNYSNDKLNSIQEHHKEKTNQIIGEDIYLTRNNFNLKNNDLFKKQQGPLVYSPTLISWDDLYNKIPIRYFVLDEDYVSNTDKDNKPLSCFGQFYFMEGLKNFQPDFRKVIITDDSYTQTTQKTYYYNQRVPDADRDYVLTYPLLKNYTSLKTDTPPYTTFFLRNTFSVPTEIYTVESEPESLGIVKLFWERYLDLTYNVNTKLVECYIRLTNLEHLGFQFNHLVKIDNTLYLVNKIDNYNLTANESTKVQLKSLNTLDGLTNNNYNFVIISPIEQNLESSSSLHATAYMNFWDSTGLGRIGYLVKSIPDGWSATLYRENNRLRIDIQREPLSALEGVISIDVINKDFPYTRRVIVKFIK